MNLKTALFAGATAAVLIAAPALAQETTPPPQDPAASPTTPTPAQPQSLTLTPGAAVRGPDGELGKLEGVRNNAQGQQELTVRGADGQVRGVPLTGIRQEGADVVVAFTKAEYDAAPPVPDAAPAEPAPPPPSTTEPPTTDPADPADPSATTDPLTPPAGEEPTEPQTR